MGNLTFIQTRRQISEPNESRYSVAFFLDVFFLDWLEEERKAIRTISLTLLNRLTSFELNLEVCNSLAFVDIASKFRVAIRHDLQELCRHILALTDEQKVIRKTHQCLNRLKKISDTIWGTAESHDRKYKVGTEREDIKKTYRVIALGEVCKNTFLHFVVKEPGGGNVKVDRTAF